MSDLSLLSCEHLRVLLSDLVRQRLEALDPAERDAAGSRLLEVATELDVRVARRGLVRDRRRGDVPSPARGVPRLVHVPAARTGGVTGGVTAP